VLDFREEKIASTCFVETRFVETCAVGTRAGEACPDAWMTQQMEARTASIVLNLVFMDSSGKARPQGNCTRSLILQS
jgi:hypothetical protein